MTKKEMIEYVKTFPIGEIRDLLKIARNESNQSDIKILDSELKRRKSLNKAK